MKDVFAKRLKSARTLAGLSQVELVKCIGGLVTKNAIAKYERGEMMADGKVLISLANVLNVDCSAFYQARKNTATLITSYNTLRAFAKEQQLKYTATFGYLIAWWKPIPLPG